MERRPVMSTARCARSGASARRARGTAAGRGRRTRPASARSRRPTLDHDAPRLAGLGVVPVDLEGHGVAEHGGGELGSFRRAEHHGARDRRRSSPERCRGDRVIDTARRPTSRRPQQLPADVGLEDVDPGSVWPWSCVPPAFPLQADQGPATRGRRATHGRSSGGSTGRGGRGGGRRRRRPRCAGPCPSWRAPRSRSS